MVTGPSQGESQPHAEATDRHLLTLLCSGREPSQRNGAHGAVKANRTAALISWNGVMEQQEHCSDWLEGGKELTGALLRLAVTG